MKYKPYKKRKEEFDNQVFSYIMKRLFDDPDETDACHEGIIDGIGNIVEQPKAKNQWSYTMFDQFINMIKQRMGQDNLRELFSDYSDVKNIDALYIMNDGKMETNEESLKNIITKVNDKTYLPDYLYHKESFVEEEEGFNFCDQLSRALTIATFLLYSLRRKCFPDAGMFREDISESVESTFNVRFFDDYEKISDFCKNHQLIDFNNITSEGIRMVVEVARELYESGLLNNSKSPQNQSANWIKLAKVK